MSGTGIEPTLPAVPRPALVWYTSYGSNMHLDRLRCYIRGGLVPGTDTVYPGCRDRRMPVRSVAVEFAGAVYFATESPVWGGGRAFYDPDAEGRVLARAHLISVEQLSDIAAQEMYRTPGASIDLAEVLAEGRAVLGDGRYETLVSAGRIDGLPALTLTAPWRLGEVPLNAPSEAYVRYLAGGLLAARTWDADAVAAYVSGCPGATDQWPARKVRELLDTGPGRP